METETRWGGCKQRKVVGVLQEELNKEEALADLAGTNTQYSG